MLCRSKQARTIEQTYFVMKQHSMKPKRNQGRIQDFPGGGRQPEENWTAEGGEESPKFHYVDPPLQIADYFLFDRFN